MGVPNPFERASDSEELSGISRNDRGCAVRRELSDSTESSRQLEEFAGVQGCEIVGDGG